MFCAECDPKWRVHNLESKDEVPLNFAKGNQLYEDNGIKYREYRALFYEDH